MAPVSWSDLPEELLESILKKPTNVVNLYNCRYVCRSWRSVVDKVLASTPPHLLVYEKHLRMVRSISFVNVFTGESRACRLPKLKNGNGQTRFPCSVCRLPKLKNGNGQTRFPSSVYSWHRWVVMDFIFLHHRYPKTLHRIFLYNPFSRARIRLPAFKFNFLDPCRKRKFIVSCETKNPRSIGLAIRDGRYLEKLMFWNTGDEKWTTFVKEPMPIVDITSYKGGFCVLDGDLKFIQFDHEHVPHLKITYVLSSYYHPTQYLVESLCGDLLLVQLNIGCKIKIFKMDWERKAWDEIKSLGDEAIFLSCAESVCIRAEDSTIFKPNCIYFTDGAFSMPVEQKELGVYDIGNQTVGSVALSIPFDDDEQCYRWFTTQI